MIEYTVYCGTYDDVARNKGSVELVYWTGGQDFKEIDEQFMAQFLGLV